MNISQFTPFVRYALIALSTWLVNQGIMSADDASTFARDPSVIELVVGVLTAMATMAWYLVSTSRKALVREVNSDPILYGWIVMISVALVLVAIVVWWFW